MTKIIIQGGLGSFHHEVSQQYFGSSHLEVVCADSFQKLATVFTEDKSIDYAVMAIENSIAGTILQNYKIVREKGFWIVGEVYHRIKMNLMSLAGTALKDITEIHSHPMAIYQCIHFLNTMPHVKIVESDDTAMSAQHIAINGLSHVAAIASRSAASLYDLHIISSDIEDNKQNYTRFFILSRAETMPEVANKASVWCRLSHQIGSLATMLQVIADENVNLSKLQSYPVVGRRAEYSFHLDLEFDNLATYSRLKSKLLHHTFEYKELGLYQRSEDILSKRT